MNTSKHAVLRNPAIKAGSAHDTANYLDVYQPGARVAVLERMPAKARDAFLAYGRTQWIPAEIDQHFVGAIVEEFGGEGAVSFVRASVKKHFEGALLKTVVNGVQRLFGMTPGGLLRMLPRTWPMVFRDVATLVVAERDDRHVVVRFDDFWPTMLVHPGYLASIEGLLWGVLDACGADGSVRLDVDETNATLTATVRW